MEDNSWIIKDTNISFLREEEEEWGIGRKEEKKKKNYTDT